MVQLKDKLYGKVTITKIIKKNDNKSNIWNEVSEEDEDYQIYNLINNKNE